MQKLTLTLPGGNTVGNPPGFNSTQFTDLASVVSGLLNIAFYIAIFMAFYWLVWATFQYILASGKKESLAKARSKITWALVGLVVVLAAYLITTYASERFPVQGGPGGLPF